MATKREQVLDAAIEVLGTGGSRALTHRAVDQAADLPAGSTSNYFRTREALLCGVAERLEQRDHADWTAMHRRLGPLTLDHLVDALARFITHASTTDPTRTQARLALFGESQAMPAVAESLQRGHGRLREQAIELAAQVGIGHTDAAILVDYMDGAVIHRLTGADHGKDPREALERLARALPGNRS
ncbi:TetR/AcrR family transcriptional regulator [Nocardia caishijiensis]|uniref:TetR family transcriptional regulator n=1 Tax=Nocardia caishijiensis TaxID=184756 RepID=A0ABQ6YHX7_9NOCA|nr:TetR family transcriptional regulator [Nocardia caishijiensis]KAF0845141.1 TetR family transcriptional regulator [Nocardia caishijiensis]